MKRVEQLVPLSHDHHRGLVLARKVQRVAEQFLKDNNLKDIKVDAAFDEHLANHPIWQEIASFIYEQRKQHFKIEEKHIVLPLLEKVKKRTTNDVKVVHHKPKNETACNPEDWTILANRVVAEHKKMTTLLDTKLNVIDKDKQTVAILSDFATLLRRHIKFEEQVLFPLVQDIFSTQELNTIANGFANI